MNNGESFILGFQGTELSEDIKANLKEIRPCGIILFESNIESRKQVQKLNRDLRKLLGDNLLTCIDQEGGTVERLNKISPKFPSMEELGLISKQGGAEDALITYTRDLVLDLQDLGFNLNLAPCLDLNTNPDNPIIGKRKRSLGADPKLVSKQAKTIIETYHLLGMKCCAKHFPGHGNTPVDSHLELPVMEEDPQIFKAQLEPFIAAIEAGVDMIMMAHITYPNIIEVLLELGYMNEEEANRYGDYSDIPASISPIFIKHLLRDRLGFRGKIITDDLEMQAISQGLSPSEICARARNAGIDLLLWHQDIKKSLSLC